MHEHKDREKCQKQTDHTDDQCQDPTAEEELASLLVLIADR